MKIVLKYTRLAKPRGGWYFPLWFRIGPEWEENELSELVPTWKWTTVGSSFGDLLFYKEPNPRAGRGREWSARQCFEYALQLSAYSAVEQTWYFATRETREQAVRCLHQEVQAIRDLVAQWLDEQRAVPGDEVVTEVSYTITTTSDSAASPVTAGGRAERRYNLTT